MSGQVAVAIREGVGGIVGGGTVPGEEVLVRVEGPVEAAPIVPVGGEGVEEVGGGVEADVELLEVGLRKARGDVVFRCRGGGW